MRQKKEHYRNKLPHFQQPGQWYSVTCVLFGAVPKGALADYAMKLEAAKNNYQLVLKENSEKSIKELLVPQSVNNNTSSVGTDENQKIITAKKEYSIALKKYRLAYDKFLHNSNTPTINLNKEENRSIINEALHFWEEKRIDNHAFCIMRNHFHWVLSVKKWDIYNKPVYLEDILHSVKLFTAKRINLEENHSGQLWEHESFDTTLRSTEHFYNAMNYTLQNPVSAGLVKNWRDWPGTWISKDLEMDF